MGHVQLSAGMLDWVHFRLLAAALRDLRVVPQTLLSCLGCVFSSFFLMQGEALVYDFSLETLFDSAVPHPTPVSLSRMLKIAGFTAASRPSLHHYHSEVLTRDLPIIIIIRLF